MAFSPGFLQELRDKVKLSEAARNRVANWDRKKSNFGRRDFWAPCPFHDEKTASFHIDDNKGRYHCFSCEAGGNIFEWFMQTERMNFVEAVKKTAELAGVPIPETPRDRQKNDQKKTITEALRLSLEFFEKNLHTPAGKEALHYMLSIRKFTPEALKKFNVGFAPAGRTTLTDYLQSAGLDANIAEAAGVTIKPEDGSPPYDRFRNRVIFPVFNRNGEPITFGGRALSPDAKAKYLNGPETTVFHKSATLYNFDKAARAVGKSGRLILCEGYTDVMAMAQAGIEETVAPMGTALTEDQMRLLWNLSDEPILCFDGDDAGKKAACRAAERALPLLQPGKSFRFLFIPEGRDPEEYIRIEGKAAFLNLLETVYSPSSLLFAKELSVCAPDTPERAAGLEARLDDLCGLIPDLRLRKYYQADWNAQLKRYFAKTGGFDSAPLRSANEYRKPAYENRSRSYDRSGRYEKTPDYSVSEAKNVLRAAAPSSPYAFLLTRLEKAILGFTLLYPNVVYENSEDFCRFTPKNPKIIAGLRIILQEISIFSAPPIDESINGHYISSTFHSEETETKEALSSHTFEKIALSVALKEECIRTAKQRFHEETRSRFVNPSEHITKCKTLWFNLIDRHTGIVTLIDDIEEAQKRTDMTDQDFERLNAFRAELKILSEAETASE